MNWHMIHGAHLHQLSLHEQLYEYSAAYLDAGERECLAICGDPERYSYADGAVVMSLVRHATELFFKAALLQSGLGQGQKIQGHLISVLADNLRQRAPAVAEILNDVAQNYTTTIPETSENLDPELLAILGGWEKRFPDDQLHRYPMDNKGTPWQGVYAFEPHSFLRMIKSHRSAFQRALEVSGAGTWPSRFQTT